MSCAPQHKQQQRNKPPSASSSSATSSRTTSMSVDGFDHGERIFHHTNGTAAAATNNVHMERIARLNNKGVEYMCSELSQAAMYFWRSLDMASEFTFSRPYNALSTSSNHTKNKKECACGGSKHGKHHHDHPASSSTEQKNNVTAMNSKHNNNLCIYQHRDEFDEAMKTFSEPIAINDSDELSIPSSTATILFNLGLLNLRLNKDEEASSCFSVAYHIAHQQEQNSKKQDQQKHESNNSSGGVSVIAILHNLGYLQYRNGDYEDAVKTYKKALRIGKDHVASSTPNLKQQKQLHQNSDSSSSTGSERRMLDVASTLDCLGILQLHLQSPDTEQAMDLCMESLSIRRRILGSDCDNIDIASTLNNIGRVHYTKGEYEGALRMYSHSLQMRRRLYSISSSTAAKDDGEQKQSNDKSNIPLLDIASTIFNVGQTYHQLGSLSKAMELYEESIDITKKQLGENHFDVAVMLKCMAQIHHERKDYNEAIKLYKQALTVEKTALGKFHEEVASTLNKLGNLLYEKGDYEVATKIYKEGLQVERAVLDVFHPNIAVTLCNIGHICKLRNEYAQALRLYKEAVVIQRHTLGRSHSDVSATLSSIAFIHYQSKSYKKAFNIYREVLVIQRDSYGDNHLKVASTLNSIGLVLFKLKLYKFALQSFQKNLYIRCTLLGSQHRDVAIILFNIATIYLELGDDDEAITYYHEALRIERKAIAESDINKNSNSNDAKKYQSLVSTIQHIGHVHQQRGELDEAVQYFSEALEIQRSSMEASSSATAENNEQSQTPKESSDNNNEDEEEEEEEDYHSAIAQTLNNLGNIYLQRGNTRELVRTLSDAVRHLRMVGKDENDLNISGFDFYEISKRHPECASVA